MKTNMKQLGLLVLASAVAVACTKDAKYDYLPKERVESKANISTNENYVYQLANLEATRTSPFARPFFVADTKLVRLRFTENSLQVVEVDPEGKFDSNSTNQKPVIEIPVEHLAYRCKEDKTGECTNSEELDEHTTWQDRPSFKPNLTDIKTTELAMLAPEIAKVVGCAEETGQRFVSYKIEEDAINIVVEKNFKLSIFCAGGISSPSDLSYSALYHYSLVKESKVASKDYQPIRYPRSDESTFGFFTTEYVKLDVDNSDTVDSEVILMNRWNPNRKTIPYLLSDNLFKEENKKVLEATLEGVKRVNKALVKAGTNLEVVTEKQDGRSLGDLRNSSIIVVEDPLEFRVIGYGPSVANPTTGEILSARTVMYLGTIKTLIRRTYEEIWAEQQAVRVAGSSEASVGEKIAQALNSQGLELMMTDAHNHERSKKKHKKQDNKSAPALKAKRPTAVAEGLSFKEMLKNSSGSLDFKNTVSKIVSGKEFSRSTSALFLELQEKYKLQDQEGVEFLETQLAELSNSKHCFLDGSNLDLNDSLVEAIKAVVGDKMVAWDNLNDSQKQEIVDLVLPVVWIPTLVHEIGHNLGLRHNFSGSNDSENYYTAEELAAEGITRPVTYSSVMDYSYNTVNELPMMGKYDVAALRFGYNRVVEVIKDKKVELLSIPVHSNIKQTVSAHGVTLKDYGFCTDEHTVINPNCNRFDEGSNFTEIAEHHIRSYEEGYKRNNFRNNKRNFSIYGEKAYLERIDSTFLGLRSMMEMKERLMSTYGIEQAAFESCPEKTYEGSCDFIEDIGRAANLAAQFFVKVLKTPDVLCLLGIDQDKDGNIDVVNGNQPRVTLAPLRNITSRSASCMDPAVVNHLATGIKSASYIVLAEGGKLINSFKSPENTNAYIDQIDVRGIWIDKILALQHLIKRETGYSTYDNETHNFYSHTSTSSLVDSTIEDLLLNEVASDIDFKFVDGSVQTIRNIPLDFSNAHAIGNRADGLTNRTLRIPNVGNEFHLSQAFIRNVKVLAPSNKHKVEGWKLVELANVYTDNVDVDQAGTAVISIAGHRYIALPQNIVANVMITKLKELKVDILFSVPNDVLTEIQAAKLANTERPKVIKDKDLSAIYVWENLSAEDIKNYFNNLEEINTIMSVLSFML